MPMTIGGTDYQVDIIGKNHDDYYDGSGKAPLTFQLHDCCATGYGMNDTETVVGGWKSSKMRTFKTGFGRSAKRAQQHHLLL